MTDKYFDYAGGCWINKATAEENNTAKAFAAALDASIHDKPSRAKADIIPAGSPVKYLVRDQLYYGFVKTLPGLGTDNYSIERMEIGDNGNKSTGITDVVHMDNAEPITQLPTASELITAAASELFKL